MKKINLFVCCGILGLLALPRAGGQLLLDRFVEENPEGTANWAGAGVVEDLSSAVIGAIGNAANDPIIYNVTPQLQAHESGAWDLARPIKEALGGIRFPGNPMLNSYVWFKDSTYSLTVDGFVDDMGQPVTITATDNTPYSDSQGNTFEIRPNQKYRLYLFGVGYRDGQNTLFTFNGETKMTNTEGYVVGTDEDQHFVVFEFTTPEDLTGWKLSFTAQPTEQLGEPTGAFNGLALVPID